MNYKQVRKELDQCFDLYWNGNNSQSIRKLLDIVNSWSSDKLRIYRAYSYKVINYNAMFEFLECINYDLKEHLNNNLKK